MSNIFKIKRGPTKPEASKLESYEMGYITTTNDFCIKDDTTVEVLNSLHNIQLQDTDGVKTWAEVEGGIYKYKGIYMDRLESNDRPVVFFSESTLALKPVLKVVNESISTQESTKQCLVIYIKNKPKEGEKIQIDKLYALKELTNE